MISKYLLKVFKLSSLFLTLAYINLLIAVVSNVLRLKAFIKLTFKKRVST